MISNLVFIVLCIWKRCLIFFAWINFARIFYNFDIDIIYHLPNKAYQHQWQKFVCNRFFLLVKWFKMESENQFSFHFRVRVLKSKSLQRKKRFTVTSFFLLMDIPSNSYRLFFSVLNVSFNSNLRFLRFYDSLEFCVCMYSRSRGLAIWKSLKER